MDNNYIFADETLDCDIYGGDEVKSDYVEMTEVEKHSKNIIDLIEERRLCEW